jgi:outer membrane protein OmpA-like peptidoglycan-associated protein
MIVVATAFGCGTGRLTQQTPLHHPESTDTTAEGGIDHYMEEHAAELETVEGPTVTRIGDEIRITWDCALLFDMDSAMLKTESPQHIRGMVAVLIRYPDTDIVVEGHTDSEGPEDYNQKLSERRAVSFRDCLVDMGVAPSRLTAVGHGGLRPTAPNDSENGRQRNRRIEIEIRPNAELRARFAEEKSEDPSPE